MKFGPVPVGEAVGAMLAHSVRISRRLPKSHVLTVEDVAALREAGVSEVVVAQLEPDDVPENEAAEEIAAALGTPSVSAQAPGTGRCNLLANVAGLFVVSRAVIDAANTVDPAITIATLADETVVREGRMVATVKIIPFAVPRTSLDAVSSVLRDDRAFDVRRFAPLRATMISTTLPSLKPSVMAKTEAITRDRLTDLGCSISGHARVEHDPTALAAELERVENGDLVIVFGASAVADERDVIPAAIRMAGGAVETVGMPVDPGNLLCLGTLDRRTVIGAPGCARSAAENGFDWVLRRLAAGLPVGPDWVRGLGVGGLLMEIESRPSPRDRIPVVVLAAGRSSRMGDANKLTLELDGKPLVARAVDVALAADVGPVTVVLGHDAHAVRAALEGRDVSFVENLDFASGMSTSLRVGLTACGEAAGAAIVLGDMPDVDGEGIARLAAVFREYGGKRIVAARDLETGRRGNPVIWPREMWAELLALEGDEGARSILKARGDEVVLVEIEGAALDLDTPDAFAERAGR